ncbi:MAG: hypothetical protein ACSHXF_02725 [Aquaticitalea sp.]
MKTGSAKHICFIANYYKTDVFVEVAKILIQNDYTVYWITPNKKQYDYLSDEFSKDQVLYIGKKQILNSQLEDIDYDLKINELVYGDRVLKEESPKWTFKYLLKLKNVYYHFIKRNEIQYVFGELTWAHELVAIRLFKEASELNCEFVNPHTIRIPNGRFAFFSDEFQSVIKEVNNALNVSNKVIKAEKPAYLALNDKFIDEKSTLKHNLKLLKNFIFRTNQDANDPTLYSHPWIHFKIKTNEIINRFLFKAFVSESSIEELPKGKKTILFTLHKQPEASIDVIGRYYENQLNLIKNVWRMMPEDYILLVKEHSNAIGDRDLKFYKEIKKLRHTFLVDNSVNSYLFLEHSQAVFTVSGTIAYEAALKGGKSFTFAPTFFNRLNGCNEISWKDFRNNQTFEGLLKQEEIPNLKDFSEWLLKNSFEGIMSDSYGDPRCMETENIKKLSEGFISIMN